MGLIGGIARTAVVAGTATAVSNRVSRRQAERWAEQDPDRYGYGQPETYAPEPEADDKFAQLEKLGQLKASGVLTDAEFEAEKAKILS